MDPTYIIGTVITILTLGLSLYATFRKNIAAHKTTQGKINAAIQTAQTQQSKIDQLAKDVETLSQLIKKI